MTSSDFIKLARRKLDDLVGTSTSLGWSDDDILDYLYEVSVDVAQEARCIRDANTVDVCQIDVETGTSLYDLHESIIDILRVDHHTTTTATELKLAAEEYVATQCIKYKTTDGVPSLYLLEDEGIRLDRVPTEDGTLYLKVVRGVLTRPTKAGECSEIPPRYHGLLLNGVLARAFMKPDSLYYSRFKGDAYMELQAKDTEQIKRTELRRRRGM
jgi:hypothetical protein